MWNTINAKNKIIKMMYMTLSFMEETDKIMQVIQKCNH